MGRTVVVARALDAKVAGSVLGRDLLDANGNILMRAGQVLEARHLEVLGRRGVREVFVQAPEGSDGAAEGAGYDTALKVARIERMFEEYEGIPLMMELRRIALAAAGTPG